MRMRWWSGWHVSGVAPVESLDSWPGDCGGAVDESEVLCMVMPVTMPTGTAAVIVPEQRSAVLPGRTTTWGGLVSTKCSSEAGWLRGVRHATRSADKG